MYFHFSLIGYYYKCTIMMTHNPVYARPRLRSTVDCQTANSSAVSRVGADSRQEMHNKAETTKFGLVRGFTLIELLVVIESAFDFAESGGL